ncbi:hypothetical protein Tcan_00555, partial [Toxocara canis]
LTVSPCHVVSPHATVLWHWLAENIRQISDGRKCIAREYDVCKEHNNVTAQNQCGNSDQQIMSQSADRERFRKLGKRAPSNCLLSNDSPANGLLNRCSPSIRTHGQVGYLAEFICVFQHSMQSFRWLYSY